MEYLQTLPPTVFFLISFTLQDLLFLIQCNFLVNFEWQWAMQKWYYLDLCLWTFFIIHFMFVLYQEQCCASPIPHSDKHIIWTYIPVHSNHTFMWHLNIMFTIIKVYLNPCQQKEGNIVDILCLVCLLVSSDFYCHIQPQQLIYL